jgi:hypothetical protein
MRQPKEYDDDPTPVADAGDVFGQIAPEKDESAGVEAIKAIINPDPATIMMISDLDKWSGEPYYFAKLELLSELLEWKELHRFVEISLKAKISNNRQSRRESVQIASNQQEMQRPGFMDRMRGFR